jgi:hypothetical protein
VEVLPLLGEEQVFQGAKAVVKLCIELGMLSQATSLARSLMRRQAHRPLVGVVKVGVSAHTRGVCVCVPTGSGC